MINISLLWGRVRSLLMRRHLKTQEFVRNNLYQSNYYTSRACTLQNYLLTEEEFKIQQALGLLKRFKFYDEVQVDDSGHGDGPFIIYAPNLEQAKQIYMTKHGQYYGYTGVSWI